jgi:hypothetical protein
MGRTIARLKALQVGKVKRPGMYPDGGGRYLQVSDARAKSWIYRFTLRGRAREMGLGSLSAISLLDARNKASFCRRQCQQGLDPIELRRSEREITLLDAA